MFGEVIPKTISHEFSNTGILLFSPFLVVSYYLFYPFIFILNKTNWLDVATESTLTEEKENNPDVKMLTLGPRWPAEITYIREKFGIDAMGLDLFSIDESKIVIGDMHEMPFEDNSYDIVYEKNTYNKSYDFRKALDESVRVLKPGGLLIYDECMDYVEGCSENARTNLKSHKWTEIYLKDNIQEVVYSKEIPAFEKDKHWLGKVGLFAARIKK